MLGQVSIFRHFNFFKFSQFLWISPLFFKKKFLIFLPYLTYTISYTFLPFHPDFYTPTFSLLRFLPISSFYHIFVFLRLFVIFFTISCTFFTHFLIIFSYFIKFSPFLSIFAIFIHFSLSISSTLFFQFSTIFLHFFPANVFRHFCSFSFLNFSQFLLRFFNFRQFFFFQFFLW